MCKKIRFLAGEDKPPVATLPPSPEQNLSAFPGNFDRWILLPMKRKKKHIKSKKVGNLTWQSPPTSFCPTVGAGESRTNIFRHMSHWSTNLEQKHLRNVFKNSNFKTFKISSQEKIITCCHAALLYWFLEHHFEGVTRRCFGSQ